MEKRIYRKTIVMSLQPKVKIYNSFMFSIKCGGISFFFNIPHPDEIITQIQHVLPFDIPLTYPLGLAPLRVYQTAPSGVSGCC